jgi:hypothetical protein
VWKLCEWIRKNRVDVDLDEFYAVFISNPNKSVPIWYQKSAADESVPVVWDYHVIGVHKRADLKQSFVYDLDTILEFPERFQLYYSKALPRLENIKQVYQR